MNKITEVILDLAVAGWIILVLVAVSMTISSCKTVEEVRAMDLIEYYEELSCENCDEID
jgi:predicted small secreted protein